MLCLSRRKNQTIIIGHDVEVTILDVRSDGRVMLGISAPQSVAVDRAEVRESKLTAPRTRGSAPVS